jgi:hypothetical protein
MLRIEVPARSVRNHDRARPAHGVPLRILLRGDPQDRHTFRAPALKVGIFSRGAWRVPRAGAASEGKGTIYFKRSDENIQSFSNAFFVLSKIVLDAFLSTF